MERVSGAIIRTSAQATGGTKILVRLMSDDSILPSLTGGVTDRGALPKLRVSVKSQSVLSSVTGCVLGGGLRWNET